MDEPVVLGWPPFMQSLFQGVENEAGMRRLRPDELDTSQQLHAEKYFEESVYPVITPRAIDPDSEFPLLRNLSLYLVVRIAPEPGKRANRYALIPIEPGVERFVQMPSETGSSFMLIEDLVRMHLHRLFPGQTVRECVPFRVTRNANMSVREELFDGEHDKELVSALLEPCPDLSASAQAVDSDSEQLDVDVDDDESPEAADAT